MPPSSAHERRSADRFGLALPITMEGEDCAVHDLSTSGVLLQSQTSPGVGAEVRLVLEFEAGGRECRVACRGQVVRVDQDASGYNLGVRLAEPLYREDPGA